MRNINRSSDLYRRSAQVICLRSCTNPLRMGYSTDRLESRGVFRDFFRDFFREKPAFNSARCM